MLAIAIIIQLLEVLATETRHEKEMRERYGENIVIIFIYFSAYKISKTNQMKN